MVKRMHMHITLLLKERTDIQFSIEMIDFWR